MVYRGDDNCGRFSKIPDDIKLKDGALAKSQFCGLLEVSGRLQCWGKSPAAERLTEEMRNFTFESLSNVPGGFGAYYNDVSCGILRGSRELRCWVYKLADHHRCSEYKEKRYTIFNPAPGIEFDTVSHATCGLKRHSGEAVCWNFGIDPNDTNLWGKMCQDNLRKHYDGKCQTVPAWNSSMSTSTKGQTTL